MHKHCRLACDTPEGILECDLSLPSAATIAVALEAGRKILGERAIDWDRAATGIHGQVRDRGHVPADGDRIELYRSLLIEPRENRRARAAKALAANKRRR
jgi:uncharacterized protein